MTKSMLEEQATHISGTRQDEEQQKGEPPAGIAK